MKKKFLKLSMFLFLSLTAATLFAQKQTPAEAQLTGNKSWIWYQDNPITKGFVAPSSYTFSADYHVIISTGSTSTTTTWKITQVAGAEASTPELNLTIGTLVYVMTFGADKTYPEFLTLKGKKPVTSSTSFYRSVFLR